MSSFKIGDKVHLRFSPEFTYSVIECYPSDFYQVKRLYTDTITNARGEDLIPADLEQDESKTSATKPTHYNSNDTNDLIAMWSNTMTPTEFRRVMFSHITKYLYRYHVKNGKEDFEKAQEYMRRLQLFEDQQGHYMEGSA